VEVVAAQDMHGLQAQLGAFAFQQRNFVPDPRFFSTPCVDLDLRVVLCWDADLVDCELAVVEPSGERCWSLNNATAGGGLLSMDMTGGLGPEEYVLRQAVPGTYTIQARLFSPLKGRAKLAGGVTISARIYTNFGRPDERQQLAVFRFETSRKYIELARVVFPSRWGSGRT
jgi:Ca-activated chloride channel homolog